jgi:DNA-binding GntR family transcriptional regulator
VELILGGTRLSALNLSPIKLDNYKPLRELVFESLRAAIIEGLLRPGERLMEIQLAEQLGVSRTPVREAIRKLELEGLVVMMPRKGAYVAGLSIKDISDVFEIRKALEGLAAEVAADRISDEEIESLERLLHRLAEASDSKNYDLFIEIDSEFHSVLFQAGRNDRLSQMINNLREQIHRFRSTSLSMPGRMSAAVEEHRKIVEAVSQHDVDAAKHLAQEHIENAENTIMEMIRNGETDKGVDQ